MGITKEQALMAIDREKAVLTNASDRVWDNPETAFQEFKSTEILCELLEKEGFEVEKNLANIATAFSGRYGSGKPVIGFLGEYDALSGLSRAASTSERRQSRLSTANRVMAAATTSSALAPSLLQSQ